MEVTMPITDTDTHACAPAADSTSAGEGASPSARFGRVPARWLDDPGIGVNELAVLTALAVHADRDGVCVVRQRTLAGLLQRSREWVCRVLARLCQPGGFVEKEHRADRDGWNLACRYRLPDLTAPADIPTDLPGDPMPGSRANGAGGTTLDGAGNPAGDPAPAKPAMPPPVETTVPAPEAVIISASADVTGGEHQEQTSLNKDSPSGATLRCADCHCRKWTLDNFGAPNGAVDRNRLVPADWQPDEGDLAWLAAHRRDLDSEYMTAVFVCGSRARGLRYADLSAAWRRWALAERVSSRRPVASAEPHRDFRDPPRRPMPSTKSEHHVAQEVRNAAIGREVLASMMARRGAQAEG
jgi:hypothetical protein